MPPSWGTPCDINAIYTSLKSTFNGLQFHCWKYGSIFIRLTVIDSKIREMSRNSNRIWPYSSSRSSKVIDLGVNGKPICDFLLVINCNFSHTATVFEIFTLEDRKLLILPTPPLFDAPARGNLLEFMNETYPLINWRDGATAWWKFHNANFNRFSVIHPCDGRKDRRAIAYSVLSIYAVVR